MFNRTIPCCYVLAFIHHLCFSTTVVLNCPFHKKIKMFGNNEENNMNPHLKAIVWKYSFYAQNYSSSYVFNVHNSQNEMQTCHKNLALFFIPESIFGKWSFQCIYWQICIKRFNCRFVLTCVTQKIIVENSFLTFLFQFQSFLSLPKLWLKQIVKCFKEFVKPHMLHVFSYRYYLTCTWLQLLLSSRLIKLTITLFLYSDEETKWLRYMEVQFQKIAGDDGEISLDEFKDALNLKKVKGCLNSNQ